MPNKNKHKIGIIGQGYIGKSYADYFEENGFEVVRYDKNEDYKGNAEKINYCDIIFIAVPTPTTPDGFDDTAVREVVKMVPKNKPTIIKSTILPGTTEAIQKENPEVFVMHSPEFLSENTAQWDVKNPSRNIIGIPYDTKEYKKKAKEVMKVLPKATSEMICTAREAELIKYVSNCSSYFKIIFMNMFYDLAEKLGCEWQTIRKAMEDNPMVSNYHLDPVHKGGRGAGGKCFIKDFAAFANLYREKVNDEIGKELLGKIEEKNKNLLKNTNKDLDLLKEVYGDLIDD